MNNNIQESYCSFEVSKLLKEKGFAVLVNEFFYNNGEATDSREYKANYNSSVEIGQKCSRPTHALAIEWIHVNFGIWIYPRCMEGLIWRGVIQKVKNKGEIIEHSIVEDISFYNSPQEATEAALLYTLKNLI